MRPVSPPAPSDLDAQILSLIEALGGSANADLIQEIVKTSLALVGDPINRGELKIVNTALREMRDSFRAFAPYGAMRKVSVFGSARTPQDRPECRQAFAFGRLMADLGFMVITGAGAGIMRAANEGAGRDKSFGCHISLPFENVSEGLFEHERLLKYKYFFTRKLTFVKETDGLALFPGGFGTLDECFEVMTLMQTGKSELLPVVFVDVPGGDYWVSLERHINGQLLERGLIGPEDRALYLMTTDVEEAARTIVRFYANYHSTRYVGELTVLRHTHAVSDELLDALNDEFAGLLLGGRIERGTALPEEVNEPDIADLPRLLMRFNRRSFGSLRRLIDRLNSVAPASIPPAPKAEEDARITMGEP